MGVSMVFASGVTDIVAPSGPVNVMELGKVTAKVALAFPASVKLAALPGLLIDGDPFFVAGLPPATITTVLALAGGQYC